MSTPNTETTPLTFGHYSSAVRRGNLVYTSGLVGYHDAERTIDPDFGSQVRRTFENLEVSLRSVGATLQDVVSVNAILVHEADNAEFNRIYEEYFTAEPLPVRTRIFAGLSKGVLYEMNAQAIVAE
ncbi:RidA family protein [Paenarthrobacter sp. NPDC091711]|uniref:RidA family protein n=1 Tax=Paenarthrobacter sp. NPDC091711 TaxID=3364385 RepID=UPI003812C9D4